MVKSSSSNSSSNASSSNNKTKTMSHRRGLDGVKKGNTSSPKENPFDKFANLRKKHDVVNRRVKGEDRNVGRARSKAIDDRKNSLLKDYNKTKKSNMFIDRRFGESDTNLSLEEKMFMRFQNERVKRAKKSSLYNLDDSEILTHKGKILGNSNLEDDDWVSDDDDDEGKGSLSKEVVDNLHFGGGLIKKSHYVNNDNNAYDQPKNRLTALQEIVMKSKLFKMQKKMAAEEQDEELGKVDKAFDELIGQSLLSFQPKKGEKGSRTDNNYDDEFSSYDVNLREMAFQSKARATDRTKSAEEIAIEERKQLEDLEKARIRRMKASYEAEEDKNDKKKRQRNDDELDEAFDFKKKKTIVHDDEEEEEEDGLGDVDDDEDEEDEEDEDEEDEDDEGDEENNDDENKHDDDGIDYDDEEEGDDEGDCSHDEDEDEDEDDDNGYNTRLIHGDARSDRTLRRLKKIEKAIATSQVNEMMPHNIECPKDIYELDSLIDKYVHTSIDMEALINRIVTWNSVHLPGAQGKDNKVSMHNFLDVLLKHFIRIGDCLGNDDNNDIQEQLDFLCKIIFKVCQDVPDACGPLWGRTLKIFQSQLQKRLRDFVLGERSSCWPSLGRLLLLRLLGHVFAVTDYNHSIVGSASLFLCQCLSQCPVSSHNDLSSGMLASCILIGYVEETGRFFPEVFSFTRSVLSLFIPSSRLTNASSYIQKTFDLQILNWLRASAEIKELKKKTKKNTNSTATPTPIAWKFFNNEQLSESDKNLFSSSLLLVSQTMADAFFNQYKNLIALPELLAPLVDIIRLIRPQDDPIVSLALQDSHGKLLEKATRTIENIKKSRMPLTWRKEKIVGIETKEPKFEMDYKFKKDKDPDRDRTKLKQLNRQVKREQKAAMRELRRDSNFLEQEQYKEVQEEKLRLKEIRHKNFNMMGDEQGVINKELRIGLGLKGGGSGIGKKKR